MKKSFTLIELLITFILLTILLAILMTAFKSLLIQTKKSGTIYPTNVISFFYINQSIHNYYPYLIKNKTYYIYCTKDKLSFISTSGIKFKTMNKISIYKNKSSILYKETPVYQKYFDYLSLQNKKNSKSYSITLFNNVKNFNIQCTLNKHNFLESVTISVNNFKMILKPKSSWINLINILKNKENQI